LGRIVSITGAGSGIGLATALLLYCRGATLAAADINEKGLEELEQTLRQRQSQPGQSFTTKLVDVTREVEVNAWIDATVKRFGRL
jgi:NAD(P)-dependent dehydrogenase (short-subunit alcohol dehydrogenase family)